MTFRVETYFVGEDGAEHPWRDPTTIATLEFDGYAAAARDIIEGLLEDGQPDGPHAIGLRIADPTGKLVFNYVRPSPSQAADPET